MQTNHKTTNDIQQGEVIVIGHKRGPMTTETVTKVTSTQITVESGLRFSKRTGDVIGGTSFSGTQHYIQRDYMGNNGSLMTVERMQEINGQVEEQQEKRRLYSKISNNTQKLTSLSLADLQTIANLLGLE